MSKGSDRRPLVVDDKTFADNWSRIFDQGTSSTGRAAGSNPAAASQPCAGSTPASPATQEDND